MSDKSRHTEAPWEIRQWENSIGICNPKIENDYRSRIAEISWWTGVKTAFGSKKEALANARLIAAAPALLEALEGDEALISTCQSVLTNYMVPDGICADEAIADLISLLDGPQQREIQGASKTALASARGEGT